MILGIGIDLVEVKRFTYWYTYSQEKLKKVFSKNEMRYCLNNQAQSAQRFAARFAAKEAFYKAFSQAFDHNFSLNYTLKCVEIIKKRSVPSLQIDWSSLQIKKNLSTHLSFAHEKKYACALVIIEKNPEFLSLLTGKCTR